MAGDGTDLLSVPLTNARQAGVTTNQRHWPSPSASTAEAVGSAPTDPWAVGWSVRTAALLPEAEPDGQRRHGAVGAATESAGW